MSLDNHTPLEIRTPPRLALRKRSDRTNGTLGRAYLSTRCCDFIAISATILLHSAEVRLQRPMVPTSFALWALGIENELVSELGRIRGRLLIRSKENGAPQREHLPFWYYAGYSSPNLELPSVESPYDT